MNPKDIQACASQWQRSARSLEPILRAELAACNVPAAILLLEDAYQSAMKQEEDILGKVMPIFGEI